MKMEEFILFLIIFPWSAMAVIGFYSLRRLNMAKGDKNKAHSNGQKKTSIGRGKYSQWGHKGGGPGRSTTSKNYRKKPRGQG